MTSNATVESPQLPKHLTKVLEIQAELNLSHIYNHSLNISSFFQMKTARVYEVCPPQGFPAHCDSTKHKWDWGHEQRRHSHGDSQVWKRCWKKQHQRSWANKNNKERHYHPWKGELLFHRAIEFPRNPKRKRLSLPVEVDQEETEATVHLKISNKETADHFRPAGESKPDTHQDEKQERMATEVMQKG